MISTNYVPKTEDRMNSVLGSGGLPPRETRIQPLAWAQETLFTLGGYAPAQALVCAWLAPGMGSQAGEARAAGWP